MDAILLTLVIFIPMVGVLVTLFLKGETKKSKQRIRWVTLVTFVVGFLVSVKLWLDFDPDIAAMQLVERRPWIEGFGIEYYLGVDGLSVLLVMLTTFLAPLVMLGSWTSVQERVRGFCISLMLLQTGMLGAFLALDLFLFYVFWELMLIPLYFIIGIWGGARRVYAAIKLFVYTLVGSLLMLIAVLYLAVTYGTFDIVELYAADVPVDAQLWLFGFFALAFAIKVPMFPFHTWLPDAHVEAPTAGSVILAGVLLKMGTYGFMRFAMPLFPEALLRYSDLLCVLAVVGIIYGALVAMVQPDVKKLVAYSSVSHLGYVVLGLVALHPEVGPAGRVVYAPVVQGVQGGILQMVNHGLSTGALFLLVGMIYERRHTRMIKDFGGIARIMPGYAFLFMMITFSSIGLPGLNGFVGEMLVLVGVFRANVVYGVLAALGVILGAVYMLWMYRRVFYGEVTHEENRKLRDVNGREAFIIGAILVFVVWIGIFPNSFLSRTTASVDVLIERASATHEPEGPTIRVTGLRMIQPEGEGGPDDANAPPRRPPRGARGRVSDEPVRIRPERPGGATPRVRILGPDGEVRRPPGEGGAPRVRVRPAPPAAGVKAPPGGEGRGHGEGRER